MRQPRIKLLGMVAIFIGGLACNCSAQTPSPELLGLSGKKVKAISICDPYLYAATDTLGVYSKSITSPDTVWNYLGLQGKRLTAIYAYPSVLDSPCRVLAGTNPTGVDGDTVYIYASSMKDSNWSIADNGIVSVYGISSIHGFPDSVGSGRKFSVLYSGLYELNSANNPWQSESCYNCNMVVRANQRHNFVWVGGISDAFGLKMSFSSDGGDAWKGIELPIPANYGVLSVGISDSDPGICLVGAVNLVGATLDTGNTWKAILSELDVGFFGVAVDPADAGHFWAGGLKNGVGNSARLYESIDTGKSWLLVNSFTDQPGIREMATSGERGVVYFGTNSGVYRYGRRSTDVKRVLPAVPKNFVLFQNYPNPFNPLTTIAFDIPKEGYVRLGVFNVLGQEVSTLVNDTRPPGYYRVTWDATGLATGIYFYRLSGDSYIDTKPMTVLR